MSAHTSRSKSMFSGITQKTSSVVSYTAEGRSALVRIKKPRGWRLSLGQSVMVDGICSTVMRQGAAYFEVEYSPTTFSKTTVREFQRGKMLNLERSLKLSDLVDGHLVAGHVDAVAHVATLKKSGSSLLLSVMLPKSLRRFAVLHGSMAINGVGLTVAHKDGRTVTFAIVPYTASHTNLGGLAKGDAVNVETDMMARLAVAGGMGGGRVSRDAKKTVRKKGHGR